MQNQDVKTSLSIQLLKWTDLKTYRSENLKYTHSPSQYYLQCSQTNQIKKDEIISVMRNNIGSS